VSKLAGFEARWEHEIDRRYRDAASAGKREGRDAYAFDAFLALTIGVVEGGPKRTEPQHLALIRVDLTALVRGDVRDEEVCEVPGVGTISPLEARELLGDSVLKLVCENGVDVQNITHLGRGPNAVQKLALLWSSQQCTVVGCHRTHTEYDHRIDYAETEHTRVDETDKLCDFHHDLKTYQGWALVTGNGKRDFVGPDDPRHPKNARPPRLQPPLPQPEPKPKQEPKPKAAPATRARASGQRTQGDLFDLLE
jgi:hypothetical protein